MKMDLLTKGLSSYTVPYHIQLNNKMFGMDILTLCTIVSSANIIIFANSVDSDQALENVSLDLDPNCLVL